MIVDQGAIAIETSSYQRWRRFKDRAAKWGITAGGSGVLVAILLIFFYLLYEIMPLFQSASMSRFSQYPLPGGAQARTLYLAAEEQAEIGMRLDDAGRVTFFRVGTGELVTQVALPLPTDAVITSFALDSEQSGKFALGFSDGRVLLAEHDYRVSYPEDRRVITPRIDYPWGEDSEQIASAPLQQLAVRDADSALVVVGVAGGQLVGTRWVKEENFLTGESTLEQEPIVLPALDIKVERLLVGPNLKWLFVLGRKGEYRVIDLDRQEIVTAGFLFTDSTLTDARFLLGGISLMVSNARGETSQWFMVRKGRDQAELSRVREFSSDDTAIKVVATEHRRKGFATINADDKLDIYYTTSSRRVASRELGGDPVRHLALTPRANGMLMETAADQMEFWFLHNEHPDVSWSALWEKVWYESYPEPDYIWQSSAANTDFEAKYSFTPLVFGTLKAAFYAMLIAAPLAICGAIYTAYFMAPALRRKIKPLIELMEALPTVILGFLAGLWLAPFVERYLPGIFSILICLPLAVLLFAWLWQLMPMRLRQGVPDGWHPVLLVPVVVLIVVGSIEASGTMEYVFFGGDMRAWLTRELGISFDQRNAMIVGIAMGFAVIPNIFSIAEDAIFSVPKHLSYGSLALGATPWQTLVGVVLPTASPGIFSALMIGMGRAVGETMIVLMATGNTPIMDFNIFEGMRTLSANIAVEIGETEVDSTHYRVLFLAAFVLFMFTFVVNTGAEIIRQRLRVRYGNL